MSLIVRADATVQRGTGHVMRCIALAQAWHDRGGDVIFLSYCESGEVRQRIKDEGFILIEIKTPHPDPADLQTTLHHLSVFHSPASLLPFPPLFVLDGYHFDPEYQLAIRREGCKLLVIDDNNHLPYYHCDIILNQNIGAEQIEYHCDDRTTQLLGVKYVMLRREFLEYRGCKREIPDKARNILVTMGGADPDNVTLKVIRASRFFQDKDLRIKIIVGPSNNNMELLKKELSSPPFSGFPSPVSLLPSPLPQDMPKLMVWADLAVTAGGSTCWELCFIGVPFLLVFTASNQKFVCAGLDRKKICNETVWWEHMEEKKFATELFALINSCALRSKKKDLGRKLIDGLGNEKILMEFM